VTVVGGVVAALLVVASPAPSPELHRGVVTPSVECRANAAQSYALYLPSRYAPDRPWPIVYVLEPAARGGLPVEAMRRAAERWGAIVAGSNNSRNGPLQRSLAALEAMWNDTHARFSVDDARVYFAGFSGGARVASTLAEACRCTHGILLNGAGLIQGAAPPKGFEIPVFAAVGTADFNYGEMVTLDTALDATGAPHVLRRFDGPHQWAPPEVWDEAFEWLALLEMKDGRRPRDPDVIRSALDDGLARVSRLEGEGKAHWALRDARAMLAALAGLADTSTLGERAAALEKSRAARDGARREQGEIEAGRSLEGRAQGAIVALRDAGGDDFKAWRDAQGELERLRRRLEIERKEHPTSRVADRVQASVAALAFETGRGLLDGGDYASARRFFDLVPVIAPANAWVHVFLARCLAAQGDRKGALRELGAARDLGTPVADLPARFPELAPLASEPAFVELAGTSTESPAPPR
jgi:predicted esterase